MSDDNDVRPEVPTGSFETRLSRRTILRGALGATALTAVGRGAAGAQGTPAATEDFSPSGVEGVPDAYLRMPEPFTSYDGVPGNGGTVRAFMISYNPPPPARGDNQYWQELERRLGVTWEPILTPQPSYGDKSAALIAAGDWPDFFYLNPGQNAQQQYQAMAQGAFLDLTPYVTGDAIQPFKNLATYPSYMWENVKFNGKIYGVPRPLWRNGNLPFIRADWATNLGLGIPANAQEFHDLLVAFSNNDPDGNGSADTWGTGRFSSGWRAWDSEFALNMFGTPYDWRLNADGTLTHMAETDEYRQAIDFLRQLYADGAYYPDAAAMTFTDCQNNFIAGQLGLHFEGFLSFFGIGNVTYRMQEINPDAQTVGFVPPGPTGGQGVTRNELGYFGYVAIPTAIGEDEDRVQELLRILDYLAAPFGSEENIFLSYGLEGVHHTVQEDGSRIINDDGRAQKSDLTYLTASLPVYYYPENPEIALPIQQLALSAISVGIDNPTLGLYAETWVAKQFELDQLGQDRIMAIITGREPLDSLDDTLADWRSRGGDDARNEFQETLQGQ